MKCVTPPRRRGSTAQRRISSRWSAVVRSPATVQVAAVHFHTRRRFAHEYDSHNSAEIWTNEQIWFLSVCRDFQRGLFFFYPSLFFRSFFLSSCTTRVNCVTRRSQMIDNLPVAFCTEIQAVACLQQHSIPRASFCLCLFLVLLLSSFLLCADTAKSSEDKLKIQ